MTDFAERPFVIAAGGTGGHMFPAMALARELRDRGRRILVLTDRRGARYVDQTLPHRLIAAGSLSGGLRSKAAALAHLGIGFVQSLMVALRAQPSAAACFGGYPTIAPGFAMVVARVPLLLHEQNALLGKANRLLAGFAKAVALTFDETEHCEKVQADRRLVTGNPVRPGFSVDTQQVPSDKFRVLVLGGSQGARVFSDVVPAAVALLPEEIRGQLRITQQCRPEDLERVGLAYGAINFPAELKSFFDDVPERMANADLLITRSGASTIAEILALGRPSILVPYAYAAEDHQRFNADCLAQAGASRCVTQDQFSPAWLKDALLQLMRDRLALETMGRAAASLATPDASRRLADALIALALKGER